jgi:hypothetical protein
MEMKLFDSARAYLAELVRFDPSYKDATTRLDKLAEINENLRFGEPYDGQSSDSTTSL